MWLLVISISNVLDNGLVQNVQSIITQVDDDPVQQSKYAALSTENSHAATYIFACHMIPWIAETARSVCLLNGYININIFMQCMISDPWSQLVSKTCNKSWSYFFFLRHSIISYFSLYY